MWKWIQKGTIVMILVIMTACAAAGHNSSAPAEQPDEQERSTPENEQEQRIDPGHETNMEEQEIEDEPILELAEEEEAEVVEMRYYMTKDYRIQPLDEEADHKLALLTFDDGPKDEALVLDMLETLDRYEAKAIFFVNGYRVEQNPELLQTIHERGQVIGNHSWDHINLREQSVENIRQQIEDVQSIVAELTGASPRFFRPPFGAGNDDVRQVAQDNGLLYMTWSNGSEDWEPAYQQPDKVIGRVLEQLHPGSNILMHELPWTVEALDELLAKIREQGYEFVDPRSIQTDQTPASPSQQAPQSGS